MSHLFASFFRPFRRKNLAWLLLVLCILSLPILALLFIALSHH